jgi:hypothetical protein
MLILGLIGCTGPVSGDSEGHSAETTTGRSRTDVQPRDDLVDEHAVKWIRSEQPSDREIRVYFLMSNPKCYGARAQLRDTPNAIEIAVIEGRLPSAPENCALVAAEASILITLDKPVASRRITQP